MKLAEGDVAHIAENFFKFDENFERTLPLCLLSFLTLPQKSLKTESVSTSTLNVSESRRYHSPSKLTKQFSLTLGSSAKLSVKSLKCLKPSLFHNPCEKLIQSDLSLNNPRSKHLIIPNPNYFVNVKERKESSSSNITDNEDSNCEGFCPEKQQLDKVKRFKRSVRNQIFSQNSLLKSEGSQNKEKIEKELKKPPMEMRKARKHYKGKHTGRNAVSLWCLKGGMDDYKLVEEFSRKQGKLKLSDGSTEDAEDVFDCLFDSKIKTKSRNSKQGSRVLLHEDSLNECSLDSAVYMQQSKCGTKAHPKRCNFCNAADIINHEQLKMFSIGHQNNRDPYVTNSYKLANNIEAYGKTLSKKLFMNLKLSLFGHATNTEKVRFAGERPIVFGGTYPIDMPLGEDTTYPIFLEKDTTNKALPTSEIRTFEIDAPIEEDIDLQSELFSQNYQEDCINNVYNVQ